jgi:hypothetical protein
MRVGFRFAPTAVQRPGVPTSDDPPAPGPPVVPVPALNPPAEGPSPSPVAGLVTGEDEPNPGAFRPRAGLTLESPVRSPDPRLLPHPAMTGKAASDAAMTPRDRIRPSIVTSPVLKREKVPHTPQQPNLFEPWHAKSAPGVGKPGKAISSNILTATGARLASHLSSNQARLGPSAFSSPCREGPSGPRVGPLLGLSIGKRHFAHSR